jgi:hypothetical protein
MRIMLSVTIVIILSGCVAKLIPYKPTPLNNVLKAKKDMEYVLFTQLSNKAPIGLRITNDYIAIGRIDYTSHFAGRGLSQTTSHDKETRIYLKDILECKLYKKRSYFPVFVYNKDNYIVYQGFFPSKEKAQLFINSLYTLINDYKTRNKVEPVVSANSYTAVAESE